MYTYIYIYICNNTYKKHVFGNDSALWRLIGTRRGGNWSYKPPEAPDINPPGPLQNAQNIYMFRPYLFTGIRISSRLWIPLQILTRDESDIRFPDDALPSSLLPAKLETGIFSGRPWPQTHWATGIATEYFLQFRRTGILIICFYYVCFFYIFLSYFFLYI